MHRLVIFLLFHCQIHAITKRNLVLDVQWKRLAKICISGQLIFAQVSSSTSAADHLSCVSTSILSNEPTIMKGNLKLEESDADNAFRKGKQLETDGEFLQAQRVYEQVLEVDPNFIYAWSSLGNVLAAQGELNDALLCYKKSLSLQPPPEESSVVLLNKAAIESSQGLYDKALIDLDLSERLGGSSRNILPLRAVTLSNEGRWDEAVQVFSQVISSGDRNAQPWWLRYSMSLMEIGRGIESVAFLQRTLNRFPTEVECLAFAAGLYASLGSEREALEYWKKVPVEDRKEYSSDSFLSSKLHWGVLARGALKGFLTSDYYTKSIL